MRSKIKGNLTGSIQPLGVSFCCVGTHIFEIFVLKWDIHSIVGYREGYKYWGVLRDLLLAVKIDK